MLQRKTQWKALRRARTGTIFGTHSTWKTPRGRENMNTSKKSRERMKAIQHIHWLDDWGRYWVCPPKSGLGGQNGRVSNLSTEKRFGWREYVKRVSEESERREWVKRMSEENEWRECMQKSLSKFWEAFLEAVRKGLEPSTSGVTGRHSNQLNYRTLRLCIRDILSFPWMRMQR